MKRLEARWQRRWEDRDEDVRTFRLVETAKIRCSADEVWELVSKPEHAPLTLPEQVARGFAVPGTPAGVGGQQCFIDHEGNASIYEVLEHEPARRQVSRLVSPAPAVPVRSSRTLEPLGTACLLTVGTEMDSSRGWSPAEQRQWTVAVRDYLERVRRILED